MEIAVAIHPARDFARLTDDGHIRPPHPNARCRPEERGRTFHESISEAIHLEAGHRYWLETLYKENATEDSLR